MSVYVGRFLQMMGLVVLPIGLMIGLIKGDVRTEVRYLAVGAFIYLLGWLISRKID